MPSTTKLLNMPPRTSRKQKDKEKGQSSSEPARLETLNFGDHTVKFYTLEAVERDLLLQTRVLLHTRTMDTTLMKELKIYNQCRTLCQKIGIWQFLVDLTAAPENYALTREFLATVKLDRDTLHFQLRNKQERITIEELNELLNFRPGDKRTNSVSPDFWNIITKATGINQETSGRRTSSTRCSSTCSV